MKVSLQSYSVYDFSVYLSASSSPAVVAFLSLILPLVIHFSYSYYSFKVIKINNYLAVKNFRFMMLFLSVAYN